MRFGRTLALGAVVLAGVGVAQTGASAATRTNGSVIQAIDVCAVDRLTNVVRCGPADRAPGEE